MMHTMMLALGRRCGRVHGIDWPAVRGGAGDSRMQRASGTRFDAGGAGNRSNSGYSGSCGND